MAQLEKGNKFESGMAGLSNWLSGLVDEMEGLRVQDPKSSAIEAQQGRCQVYMVTHSRNISWKKIFTYVHNMHVILYKNRW